MCGFVGSVLLDNSSALDVEKLSSSLQLISHRGPDSSGIWHDKSAMLGHCRLSIIDLSTNGSQPMESSCGRYVLAFNGEIYNFLKLREELSQLGISFDGSSDTEVLIEFFSKYGIHKQSISRIEGMFAIAVWDKEEKSLYLIRDRVGKKPLFISYEKTIMHFASEIPAVQALCSESLIQIERNSIVPYFRDGFSGIEKTFYSNIKRVLPGHYYKIKEGGGLEKVKYWSVPCFGCRTKVSFFEAVSNVENLLNIAVKKRLISDAPLGIFLSGGIDSGLVTAFAAKNSINPVKTMTIGFDDAQFDERSLSRLVSKRYGTDHSEVVINSDDMIDNLHSVIKSYGEPFGDASALPSNIISKIAAKKLKVVLNGDGGDELFAGYRRQQISPIISKIESYLPFNTARKASGFMLKYLTTPKTSRTTYSFAYRALSILAEPGNFNKMVKLGQNCLDKNELYFFLNGNIAIDYMNQNNPYHVRYKDHELEDALREWDFLHNLPGVLLTKMDIASMQHSIEARSPFLDTDLVEYALSLPLGLHLHNGKRKRILMEISSKYLPEEITFGTKKGFEIPLYQWMKFDMSEIINDTINTPNTLFFEIFEKQKIELFFNGGLDKMYEPNKWAQIAWQLFVFAIWSNKTTEYTI